MPMRTNQHSWMLRATCCCRLAQEPSAYTSVLSSDVIHVDKVIVRAHSQVAERQTLSNQIDKCAAAVAGYSFPRMYGLLNSPPIWRILEVGYLLLRVSHLSISVWIAWRSKRREYICAFTTLYDSEAVHGRKSQSCTNVHTESVQDKRERSLA